MAAELTIAQEPRGTGTLEVVVLAELTLVAAFTIAHALPTLALATPRARLVLTLPQAGLCVTQRAGGAVAVFATPEGETTYFPTAGEKAGAFTISFYR